jgi:hypothetical protein
MKIAANNSITILFYHLWQVQLPPKTGECASERGCNPLSNIFPLSCGTPRQERGIKGVRYIIKIPPN